MLPARKWRSCLLDPRGLTSEVMATAAKEGGRVLITVSGPQPLPQKSCVPFSYPPTVISL